MMQVGTKTALTPRRRAPSCQKQGLVGSVVLKKHPSQSKHVQNRPYRRTLLQPELHLGPEQRLLLSTSAG